MRKVSAPTGVCACAESDIDRENVLILLQELELCYGHAPLRRAMPPPYFR